MDDLNAPKSPGLPATRRRGAPYWAATDRWCALLRHTASAGHTPNDVARAAGFAQPSLYRHLRAWLPLADARTGRSTRVGDGRLGNQWASCAAQLRAVRG